MNKEEINNLLKSTHREIDSLLDKDIVIYGLGNVAIEVYKLLQRKNKKITYFLDKDISREINFKDEVKIYSTSDDYVLKSDKTNILVIVSIFNSYSDVNLIINNLKKLNFNNIVTYADLYECFSKEFRNRFYLNTASDFLKDIDKIINVEKLFDEEKSKKLYDSLVKFRITKEYRYLADKEILDNQYFPEDINVYGNKEIRFIDCGAYNGDTINSLCRHFSNIEAAVMFEPDLYNYKSIFKNITPIKEKIKEMIIIPCAVYSNAEQLEFDMVNSEGSCICKSGKERIQCVSIDECIGTFNPTIIKMDIEGAEYDGLLGAKQTILNKRPNLMICLYHKPTDLYEIPLLINNWNIGYKFYLRMYGYNGFEVVLYAVNEN